MVSNILERFFVLILQEKIKKEVRSENCCNEVINLFQGQRNFHIESNEKYSCHARVSNDKQVKSIEDSFPFGILTNDKVFWLEIVPQTSFFFGFLLDNILVFFHGAVLVSGFKSNIVLEEVFRLI